jgi:hypothetical protein
MVLTWWVGGLLGVPMVFLVGALTLNRASLVSDPGPVERLRTYLTHHAAITDPTHPFPELRPRCYLTAMPILARQIESTMRELGWEVAAATGATPPAYWRAVATTPLLRFRDDIEVRVSERDDGWICLDVASHSRVGHGDFGANRRHVLDLYRGLEARGLRPLAG